MQCLVLYKLTIWRIAFTNVHLVNENNIPKYVLLDNDFKILAFPDLFPYGSGAYNSEERSVKLPICKYFQQ